MKGQLTLKLIGDRDALQHVLEDVKKRYFVTNVSSIRRNDLDSQPGFHVFIDILMVEEKGVNDAR